MANVCVRALFSSTSFFKSDLRAESGIFYNTKANNEHFTAGTMASLFSGVLQLTDLDDFITPSQVTKLSLHVTTTYYLYQENAVIGKDPYRRTVVNGNVELNVWRWRSMLFVKEQTKTRENILTLTSGFTTKR